MVPVVNKEQMRGLFFSTSEVLGTKEEQETRAWRLGRSLSLGNLYKDHVYITFTTKEGKIAKTLVTVWAITEKHVMIKGQLAIPIHSILDVEFC